MSGLSELPATMNGLSLILEKLIAPLGANGALSKEGFRLELLETAARIEIIGQMDTRPALVGSMWQFFEGLPMVCRTRTMG